VPITVTLTSPLPGEAAGLDQVPVQVEITADRRENVLMVPVVALLPDPRGGYQVRVVDGDTRRLVPVGPGLYDDVAETIEITGDGIAEAMLVEVPAS
jgi:hypothetical protein